MSSFLERFKSNKEKNESLIAIELKADSIPDSIQNEESKKVAQREVLKNIGINLEHSGSLEKLDLEDIAFGAMEETLKEKKSDIITKVAKLSEQRDLYESEMGEYKSDMAILDEIGENRKSYEVLKDIVYEEAFPTIGERLFGSSNKELGDKYEQIINVLNRLDSKEEAIDSKWNISKEHTSEVQSLYESIAGRGEGGATFYTEVRDPERYHGKGEAVSRKTRLENLHSQFAEADKTLAELLPMVDDYSNIFTKDDLDDLQKSLGDIDERDFNMLFEKELSEF
tara:strand:+ start:11325 stop:12173 length:849 start_codon:yes stop_codon:yes gene_type:complete